MPATRRVFLRQTLPGLSLLLTGGGGRWIRAARVAPGNRNPWRAHFPALRQRVGNQPLIYLDTAATAQRPRQVTEAVARFTAVDNANPGARLHTLARRADQLFQEARATVARFLHAPDPLEIVWTRGTTEAINLVAATWSEANLRPGDEVLLTEAEHASSMLPWQLAARRAGAVVRYLPVGPSGRLEPERLDQWLTPRTRVVCFTHVSNVTGAISPAPELARRARAAGAIVMIDAAQSAPHLPIDVQALGCDFLAFSGHKLMGPMGTGVLWGRRELLDALPPYQSGSNAAHAVDYEGAEWSPGGLRFGAGTPNVAGAIGLAAAIGFLGEIGFAALRQHESRLTAALLQELSTVPGLRLIGPAEPEARIGVCSFTLQGKETDEVMMRLDQDGIAVRSGDLAALPLLRHFGVERAARASLYLYNTPAEVERLGDRLRRISRS
jgi:cysteine desulfurase / selenocysteine lyase